MKAIINKKMYDTEKADKVISFTRWTKSNTISMFGGTYTFPSKHNFTLYKTAKGNYFEHDETGGTIHVVTEDDARGVVLDLDPDLYVSMFGKVEEA